MTTAEKSTSGAIRRGALTFAFLLAMSLGARTAQATTFSDAKQVTVQYRPGSGSQNGFEVASIEVGYRFADCGRTIQLHHRVRPETLRHHRFYWYEGQRYALPDSFPEERRTSVPFQGRAAGPGVGSYEFSATASTSGDSCMSGDLKVALSEAVFDRKAPESQKQFRLNGMTVATAAAGFYAPPLESAAAERYIRDTLLAGKRNGGTERTPPPAAVTPRAPTATPSIGSGTPTIRPRSIAPSPSVVQTRAPVTKPKTVRRMPQDCTGTGSVRVPARAAYSH